MKRTIEVYSPAETFPSVSVTGSRCTRSCEHCGGRYLSGMKDVGGPGSLLDFGISLAERGGKGMLVSGGCGPDGSVPIDESILSQISRLKQMTDLKINMHTGLVGRKKAEMIASSGVDVVSFDLIGDNGTIREVLHLDRTVQDHIQTYEGLVDSGLKVVPHILAGLHFGTLKGEKKAVDIVSEFRPERAVLILLIPTRGTPMENVRPLGDRTVMEIAGYMRNNLDGDLILGCMRPRGKNDLEISILDLGFNGIVQPSKKTIDHVVNYGWKLKEKNLCCAMGSL